MTKKEKIGVYLSFGLIYLLVLGFTIYFLVSKNYGYIILVTLPSVFLIPVFLTFYRVPKEPNHHKFMNFLCIALRYLMVFSAIFFPALLWYKIEWIHESVLSYFLLIPALEILFVYIIIFVLFIFLGKDEDQARKQRNI